MIWKGEVGVAAAIAVREAGTKCMAVHWRQGTICVIKSGARVRANFHTSRYTNTSLAVSTLYAYFCAVSGMLLGPKIPDI